MLKRVIRGALIALVAVVVTMLVSLEVWYSTLLPRQLPEPATGKLPQSVREAFLLENCKEASLRMRPLYPFFVSWFIGGQDGLCLPTGVARLHVGELRSHGIFQREHHLKLLLREIAVATWVSRHWTAQQTVDTYASLVWMGDESYGVQEGAKMLFARTLDSLSIADAALLIATTRSPKALSPTCHPDRALKARNKLLEQLRGAGVVNESELRDAVAAPLGVEAPCQDHLARTSPKSH